ncbi:sulfotransferase family 2 domain-containing protein [Alteromonas halophila]|uniref:Sulfotransferase family protein n=1 Tax=Alteromonas halophila TaxID=516698 RepID=A0A918JI89_9ALTE|nr:sulfotransferase family 2 domain-containing protein [Alteromonas halophila]GGW82344.1 hypothetical protein GCM10007391_14230 [Alteromonas halophila]
MIKRDFEKPIVFMHIPKTAGSTLHQLFQANYKADEIYKLGVTGAPETGSFGERHKISVKKFYALNKAEQIKIKAVVGHMPYGLHEVFDNDAQYITVIRHPLGRILSHYNFVKESPSHYLHERMENEASTIVDYVQKLESKELNNGMLRFFLGPDHVKIPFGGCTRDMVDIAMERVEEKFVAVGVQEYFAESVDLFCKVNNWIKPNIKSRNMTQSKYSSALEVSELDGILRYNSLDLVLYEELRNSFLKIKKKL